MFEFITENMAEVTALGAALMVLGGIIVKLTPTKKDDEWFQAIKSVFGKK